MGIFNRFLLINRSKGFALFFLGFFIFSTCFSQEAKVNVEIRSAIENVKIGNYEKAIPIFKKNLNSKKLDEFTKLEIQIFLGFCNLVAKKGKVNVDYLNLTTTDYFEKQEKFSRDSLSNRKEAEVYYFLAQINILSSRFNESAFLLLNVKDYYEKEDLLPDEIYSQILYQLGWGYYNLGQYNLVIDYCGESLEIHNRISEELQEISLRNLYLIYDSYQKLNDTKNSIFYLEKWVKIGRDLLGVENKIYLTQLSTLQNLYRENGNYKKAKEISLELVEKGLNVWGERSIEYFKYLNNLALSYSDLAAYKDASIIYEVLSKLSVEILTENHPDYIILLSNISSNYGELGEFKKAFDVNERALNLGIKYLGELNPTYLMSLGNQAYNYSQLGEYKLSAELEKKVVSLKKEALGESDPSYLMSLNNLASTYSDLGDYKSAIETIEKVIELRKIVLGEEHPDYLMSLGNQAVLYAELGEYELAKEINQKILILTKELLGELHPNYLLVLSNQARNFSDLGDFKSALDLDLKILNSKKILFGEKHYEYLASLINLAADYADLGDYKTAIKYNQQALDVREVTLGNLHPDYLYPLSNQARYYSDLGDYKSAIELDLMILNQRTVSLGENHPDYLRSLSNLASDYADFGDYETAISLNQKSLNIKKVILGENHPDYIISVSNHSFYFAKLKDYSTALKLANEVFTFRKSFFGEKHPDYLKALSNISYIEYLSKNYFRAYNHYNEYLINLQERLLGYFVLLGEELRKNFWEQEQYNISLYYLFLEKVYDYQPKEIIKGFDISLFSKGILLNTSRDFESLLTEKGTTESTNKFNDLKLLKLQIQRLYEKPIAERYLDVDSLENAAREIESDLIKESKEYGDYTKNLKITWKDVQSYLGDRDVAIEFIEYPTIADDTVKYAALVLRKGWENPKFVPLFRKDQIFKIFKQGPNQIYSNGITGKEIKKLVWDPLEEFIAPGEKVHFSAAGILHQLAIENLSYDESSTLGDRYQMYRLSSTKELALQKPQSKNQNVTLYGGIKYDLSLDEMIAGSEKYERKDSFLALRGIDQDSLARKGWQFLPGTLAEANEVGEILKENQYQVTEFIGESGSEESLKDLSGKRIGIIHIATHGFFLPVEQSKRNPFIQMRFDDRNANAGYVDPMLRSGLLLAGGNRAWQGDSIPDTIEDGVLTAKEISNLDLRGTDMVVLSACETGLGDVSSEGVFGLQRAFKQAGAQTIIMSLWNVKDEATQYLMTNFYSYLTKGVSKRDAFIQARNKCREKYQDPASWAAFIMLD
jgi:CHAT domain-containing protein